MKQAIAAGQPEIEKLAAEQIELDKKLQAAKSELEQKKQDTSGLVEQSE